MMSPLLQIGFKKVGSWLLDDDKLKVVINCEADAKNILYCFVADGEPMYIGKTIQSLKKRMYGYQNPGSSQATNIRNNKNIINVLKNGKTVELYALPDHVLLHFGEFHLNLAAGLEDSIVKILTPKWNMVGK